MSNYVKTTWNNSAAPAINAENLNKMEGGIERASGYQTADEIRALPLLTALNPKVELFGPQGGTFVVDLLDTTSDEDSDGVAAGCVIVTTNGQRLHRVVDGYVRSSWYGIISGIDCTTQIRNAIDAVSCSVSGFHTSTSRVAGRELVFSAGTYLSSPIVIDKPVNIRSSTYGNFTNSSERVIISLVGNGTLIEFAKTAGYLNCEGITLSGSKQGKVLADIELADYGNVGIKAGYGVAGTWKEMLIQGFDVNILLTREAGDAYGGSYRFFNNVKSWDSLFKLVQVDEVTDSNFHQCDFRGIGQLYFNTETGYNTARFSQCCFEGLTNPVTGNVDYDQYSFQIKGRSLVYTSLSYMEHISVFCDKNAFFKSSCDYIHTASSARFNGGGIIDIADSFPAAKEFNYPTISDTSFWNTLTGCSFISDSEIDGISGARFSTSAVGASIGSTVWSKINQISNSALASVSAFESRLIQVSYEYYSVGTAEVKVRIQCLNSAGNTTISLATWGGEVGYYNTETGWKRITYTLPIPKIGGLDTSYVRPTIIIEGNDAVSEFAVRNLTIKALSQ